MRAPSNQMSPAALRGSLHSRACRCVELACLLLVVRSDFTNTIFSESLGLSALISPVRELLMAEAIAVLGLVSSIAQIIQFSTSAVSRLREFHSCTRDTPKAFRDIEAQLPLLTDAIRRTKAEAGAGDEALVSAINDFLVQVKSLDDLLKEALPKPGDSPLKRAQKAVSSFHYEKEVRRITEALWKYMALLTFHRTAIRSEERLRGSDDTYNDPGAPTLRTYNEVPHRRVPEFIGREQLLTEIGLCFGREAEEGTLVVVLHGMGGQGKTQL